MDDGALLAYIILGMIAFLISTLILRWVFAIEKRVSLNKSMVNLLALLAKKNGVTEDEILLATKTNEEISALRAKQKREMKKQLKKEINSEKK